MQAIKNHEHITSDGHVSEKVGCTFGLVSTLMLIILYALIILGSSAVFPTCIRVSWTGMVAWYWMWELDGYVQPVRTVLPCMWNGRQQPCFLFARKFLPETSELLLELLPSKIWNRPLPSTVGERSNDEIAWTYKKEEVRIGKRAFNCSIRVFVFSFLVRATECQPSTLANPSLHLLLFFNLCTISLQN